MSAVSLINTTFSSSCLRETVRRSRCIWRDSVLIRGTKKTTKQKRSVSALGRPQAWMRSLWKLGFPLLVLLRPLPFPPAPLCAPNEWDVATREYRLMGVLKRGPYSWQSCSSLGLVYLFMFAYIDLLTVFVPWPAFYFLRNSKRVPRVMRYSLHAVLLTLIVFHTRNVITHGYII